MSAIIREGKMSFSVFGRGYEDVRADSGEGIEEERDRHYIHNSGALIDNASQYLWIAKTGNENSIVKYDLATFTDVGQTIITAEEGYGLYHPTNVDNNYGIAIGYTSKTFYVFDLTDDTVYCTGTLTGSAFSGCYDCILVDDQIYIIEIRGGRTSARLVTIDLTNQTATGSTILTNRSTCCFTDNASIYNNFPPEWFFQYRSIYLSDLAGNTIWTVQASESGSSGFPYADMNGFGGNGKLYLPTYKYGAWRMGEYNTNVAPDITTPRPKRVFGKFKERPIFDTNSGRAIAYNNRRTRVAFLTTLGLFVTDLEEIELLSDERIIVYCMNDEWVIGTDATNDYIYTFKYR